MLIVDKNIELPQHLRDEYTQLLVEGDKYTLAEAAMIIDIAWQANCEAQAALAAATNRVTLKLEIDTIGLAAYMLQKSSQSLFERIFLRATLGPLAEIFDPQGSIQPQPRKGV